MSYLSTCKIPKDSASVATVSCFLIPRGLRKSHLTVVSLSDHSFSSSSSSSVNCCSAIFGEGLKERSWRKAVNCHGNYWPVFCSEEGERSKGRDPVWVATKKSLGRKKAFWRKIVCRSNKLRSVILLNVITVVYASNICVVKEVETMMDPAAFSAMRFLICAIPFLPFVFQARNDVETRNAGMELGLWISLGYLIEALGLLTCDAGRASFISLFTLGDLLNFVSAIFFGIHTLRTEQITRSTKKESMLPLLGYEVCVIAFMSVIWYVVGGNFDGFQESDISGGWSWSMFCEWMVAFPWIPTLYTGVFSTGLCLWGEIAAMRDVSATETAVIYGLEPLWGAAFAWFLLGERWGLAGWIGAALVLGGSLTLQILGSYSETTKGSSHKKASQHKTLPNSNSLSASPVVISSDHNLVDRLNK
ncbi:PREDICTED: uncharacterized protein LOC109150243 isoform X2 [Ipomoea nil]|uniref:uncharacterized protein LOC109150243 isoform X2 n=1 Tax=Ipomoea nil TaxID=35883 RepID=UPI000900B223|nr:PREDICTED: uncharacterized protein LOC109150243 isoform X2 [Ipomoea nil]